jgi:NAD+ kinase
LKAAIYSQKKDLDTFLYLSKFISELTNKGVKPVIYEQLHKNLEFPKEFSTFKEKRFRIWQCRFFLQFRRRWYNS